MAKKEISINQLCPGMFVIGIDIAWIKSPFLSHSMRMSSQNDIDRLRKSGVKKITIDTDKGLDVVEDISVTPNNRNATPKKAASPMPQAASFKYPIQETPTSMAEELKVARELKSQSYAAAEDTNKRIKENRPLEAKPISPIIAATLKSLTRNDQAVISLLRLERSSEKLLSHLFNVFSLTLALTLRMNVSEEEREALGLAAFVHDAAWAKLPQNLFGTGKKYTAAEKKLIEKHIDIIASLLAQSDGFSPTTINIIREHHERGDGSGYPAGLATDKISLCGNILAVADTYDELIHGLAGHPGMLPNNALSYLYQEAQKGLYSVEVVAHLVGIIGVFPLNSAVELSSGERAMVVENNRSDPLRPKVKIFYSASGNRLDVARNVDLSQNSSSKDELVIQKIIDPRSPAVDPYGLMG
jgi:HD-GYP domain-containing protein (c-di-GMP phosphodiesterase class II)